MPKPLLADTSALANHATHIMARLDMIPEITLPRSISGEIYKKSQSKDPADQDVAHRAMATLACLHALPHFTIRLDHTPPLYPHPDDDLLERAHRDRAQILTADYPLCKRAEEKEIEVVFVLNFASKFHAISRDIFKHFPPYDEILPGRTLYVKLVKPGFGDDKAVGYLPPPDGRKVVVNSAGGLIGREILVEVERIHRRDDGYETIFAHPCSAEC